MRLYPKLKLWLPTSHHLTIQYQMISVIVSFLCIITIVISSNYFMVAQSPVLLASMGASLVILLFAPNSPFASYWSFFSGHLASAFIGITCAMYITPFSLASALAISGSILTMLLFRCLHPPGAATALVPVISHHSLGYSFLLIPVLHNVLVILIMVTILNRYFLKNKPKRPLSAQPANLSQQDVQNALIDENEFIDVNIEKLHELLLNAEQQKLKRLHGNIVCSDIMTKTITTVEYGDEVEAGWQKMQQHKLTAMPVVDNKNRVIGIVTWTNFLQFIEMSPYSHFQEKWMSFIRRTADITAQKPEVIGHIMTKNVFVLSEKSSIIQLIALFSAQGCGQIPIINDEKKIVGMVYQSDLIKTLNDRIIYF